MLRAFAAEFPNDNTELHAGTIWMSTEPCGPARPHFALEEDPNDTEPIEIVESIELEGPIEVVPAPVAAEPTVADMVAVAAGDDGETPVDLPPVAVEVAVETKVDVTTAAEAKPELVIEMPAAAEPEAVVAEETSAAECDQDGDDDPYALFIRKLAEVAVASGATMDAAAIDALLGTDAVASAWRAILRGESEDFSICGGALDEWAAGALAAMMAAPHKAAQIRRELRARGVAAFGLIDAA